MDIKRKFNKILFVFIINFLLCFVIAEMLCYLSDLHNYVQICTNCNLNKFKVCNHHKYFWYGFNTLDNVYRDIVDKKMKKPVGLEFKTRPILLMGCSFAYGYKLKDKENLQNQLSEIMQRPVYNRAYEWYWGLATMLYQSRRKDFYDEVPNPEFVVYVFIKDHIRRMNSNCPYPFMRNSHLRYKEQRNGELEPDKFGFKYNLFMLKKYTEYKATLFSDDESIRLLEKHFLSTKNEFDKHWKNYKFIILIYDEDYDDDFYNNYWKGLENEGFIVLSTKNLVDRSMNNPQYWISMEDRHPNALAWSLITPLLVNEINKL